MAKLVMTDAAKADADGIWIFYASTRGIDSADKVLISILRSLKQASETPGIGESQEQYDKELRRIVVGKTYLAFYRMIPNGIRVVRILHAARDISGLMSP